MGYFGKWETWKIVYFPVNSIGGARGVALIEAGDQQHAMYTFSQQYAGQYTSVASCQRLLG